MPLKSSNAPPTFLTPYRRITSTGQFIPEIDGLRFAAIFSVYIYHLAGDVLRHSSPSQSQSLDGNWLFSVTQILNFGVPLFFVISGFILGMPFASAHLHRQPGIPMSKYFRRRITRLEPPYIISLLIFFVLKVAAGRGSAIKLAPNLLASIFYVHSLVFGTGSVINFVAWSLEIEIQFYLLAPVLTYIFAVPRPLARRSLLVASVLLATLVSRLVVPSPRLSLSLLSAAQYFLTGFLLVEFYLSGGDRRQHNWRWDLVSLAGWPLLLFLLVRYWVVAQWVAPWLIFCLAVAALHGSVINRFFANPWITTIGGMCYTVYLFHNYLIASLGIVTERLFSQSSFSIRLLVQFAVMSPLVLAACALYFRWIERPCMRPNWTQDFGAALLRLRAKWTLKPAAVQTVETSGDN